MTVFDRHFGPCESSRNHGVLWLFDFFWTCQVLLKIKDQSWIHRKKLREAEIRASARVYENKSIIGGFLIFYIFFHVADVAELAGAVGAVGAAPAAKAPSWDASLVWRPSGAHGLSLWWSRKPPRSWSRCSSVASFPLRFLASPCFA